MVSDVMAFDVAFPLRYTSDGSLQTTDAPSKSQANHLLKTIAGERSLFPNFGVPLDILYTTKIPEILVERIKLALSQLSGITAEVKLIKVVGGAIQISIIFDENVTTLEIETF